MKKKFIFFIIFIITVIFVLNITYKNAGNREDIQNNEVKNEYINVDNKIQSTLLLLSKCDFIEPYEVIKGNNSLNKQIKIAFKDLSTIDEKYRNYEAIGWKNQKEELYIYINEKHIGARNEALAALIAGQSIHFDEKDSKNEECYSILVEGYVWKYLTKNKLINSNDELVIRENNIAKIINKSPKDGSVLISFINNNRFYNNLEQESNGYTNTEFEDKFKKLLMMYNNQN